MHNDAEDAQWRAQWDQEARLGLGASLGYFRRLLRSGEPLDAHERLMMVELLDLMEEYVHSTWPVPAQVLQRAQDARVRRVGEA